ncbi:MAG: hypothetical protein F9K22_10755 [Bacteroidetes bacterium]|nr:MAG: hypothetical protein F9K22_10755 [Bacteroidota bacterium]
MNTDKLSLIVCIVIACVLFSATAVLLYAEYRLGDDTYIYLRYVRNILEHKELSFNPGDPQYGVTSILWLLALVGVSKVSPDLLSSPAILSFSISLILVGTLIYLVKRKCDSVRYLLPISVILAIEPNVLRHSFLGMEAPLSALLLLLVIGARMQERNNHRFPWSALLSSLMVLNRPETILIIPFLLIDKMIWRETKAQMIVWISIFTLPAALGMMYMVSHTGSFLPVTIQAKGGGAIGDHVVLHLFDLAIIIGSVYLPWIALFALEAWVLRGRSRSVVMAVVKEYYLWFLPALIISLAYILFLSNERIYSRYMMMVMLPFVIGTIKVSQHLSPSRLRSAGPIVTLVLLYSVLVSSLLAPATVKNNRDIELSKDVLISWIQSNTLSSDIIACGMIGKIGYVTDRRIVCTMGIVNPDIRKYREEGRIREYYKMKNVHYSVGVGKNDSDVDWLLAEGISGRCEASFQLPSRSLIREIIGEIQGKSYFIVAKVQQ